MNVSSSKHLLGDYEVLLIGENDVKTFAYAKKIKTYKIFPNYP